MCGLKHSLNLTAFLRYLIILFHFLLLHVSIPLCSIFGNVTKLFVFFVFNLLILEGKLLCYLIYKIMKAGIKIFRKQNFDSFLNTFSFFFLKILFIHERHREERGRDTGRGRSGLHAGSLTWDSIQGLQDHTMGRRQAPNC